jgi:hypothetical protein
MVCKTNCSSERHAGERLLGEHDMSESSPSVSELFSRYLRRQAAVQTAGLGFADLEAQVVPHEAIPVQPVDPSVAWSDSLAVVELCVSKETSRSTERAKLWEVPPDWAKLVALQEPAFSVAFCLGNYPQMLRDFHPFLSGGHETIQNPPRMNPLPISSSILQWAEQQNEFPRVLLAAAVYRLSRRFKEAGELLRANGSIPSAWRALRANEEAALAWQAGNGEEALKMWQAQKASVPVLFNRGMASLFLNRPAEAYAPLSEAVAQLPDSSAWHHLGQLYLVWAESRN